MSNAMLNPTYALLIGGLSGLLPTRVAGPLGKVGDLLTAASRAREAGRVREAVGLLQKAVAIASEGGGGPESLRLQAEGLEALASIRLSEGDLAEAMKALRKGVELREAVADATPGAESLRELASSRVGLGRILIALGRLAPAIEERRRAVDLWAMLARRNPADPDLRGCWADALNDLAWLLADGPDPSLLDPEQAAQLAGQALRIVPEKDACWNTLGVALHRIGQHAAAVEALERSASLGPEGSGTAFDHFFLAMAWAKLGEPELARDWFDRGVAWLANHRPDHPDLIRYRDESASLLTRDQLPATRRGGSRI